MTWMLFVSISSTGTALESLIPLMWSDGLQSPVLCFYRNSFWWFLNMQTILVRWTMHALLWAGPVPLEAHMFAFSTTYNSCVVISTSVTLSSDVTVDHRWRNTSIWPKNANLILTSNNISMFPRIISPLWYQLNSNFCACHSWEKCWRRSSHCTESLGGKFCFMRGWRHEILFVFVNFPVGQYCFQGQDLLRVTVNIKIIILPVKKERVKDHGVWLSSVVLFSSKLFHRQTHFCPIFLQHKFTEKHYFHI